MCMAAQTVPTETLERRAPQAPRVRRHVHEFSVPVFAPDFGFDELPLLVAYRCACGQLLMR